MSQYLVWNEQVIPETTEKEITALYQQGYVFTRKEKGSMQQTRSIRIDLSQFELSSENRRIIRKTEDITLSTVSLPSSEYHWSIGKMAKDFYEKKFGNTIFSANKIKELITNTTSNFNELLTYSEVGFAICYTNTEIMHYSYPFYDIEETNKNMGMGMMLRGIQLAKERGYKYCYLGSAQRQTDTYKMQFKGFEWFDGASWQTNKEVLKHILTEIV